MDASSEVWSIDPHAFLKFLDDKNIIGILIAGLLGSRINEMVEEFLNHVFVPVLDIDIDPDEKEKIKNDNKNKSKEEIEEEEKKRNDFHKLSSKTIEVNGKRIKIGTIIVAIIKFLLVLVLAYLFLKLFRKMV